MIHFRFMLNRFKDIVEHSGLTLSGKQFVDNFLGHIFVIQVICVIQQLEFYTSVCCSPLCEHPSCFTEG